MEDTEIKKEGDTKRDGGSAADYRLILTAVFNCCKIGCKLLFQPTLGLLLCCQPLLLLTASPLTHTHAHTQPPTCIL